MFFVHICVLYSIIILYIIFCFFVLRCISSLLPLTSADGTYYCCFFQKVVFYYALAGMPSHRKRVRNTDVITKIRNVEDHPNYKEFYVLWADGKKWSWEKEENVKKVLIYCNILILIFLNLNMLLKVRDEIGMVYFVFRRRPDCTTVSCENGILTMFLSPK